MGIFSKLKKEPFPFREQPNVATITCKHIMKDNKPILFVSHDMDDGCWEFLCGEEHGMDDACVVALEEVYEVDKSIKDIAWLRYGEKAVRKDKDSEWMLIK